MCADNMGFVTASDNVKTGPIPVSVSSSMTCPSTCPLKKQGCYGRGGKLSLWWRRLDTGEWGMSWQEFLARVKQLPKGTFWRHGQAGDLPGRGTLISRSKLRELAKANKGKLGYAYTHKPPTRSNLSAIREAIRNGFAINLSANGPSMADRLFETGIPVVTIVPTGTPAVSLTPKGRKILICPAQRKEGMNCANCRLCARKRDFIVGFLPHGSGAKKVSEIAAVN